MPRLITFRRALKLWASLVLSACVTAAAPAQVPDWGWADGAGQKGATSGSQGIAHDAAGNVTVVGYFRDVSQFGTNTLISQGQEDLFLVQYDSQGQVRWATSAGGVDEDGGAALAASPAGDLYVTGRFQGQATFGSTQLTSTGSDDLFLAKYTADGALVWVRQVGGGGPEGGRAVALDSSGNIYVGGYFQGLLTAGAATLSSAGVAGLLLKYSPEGNLQWVRSLPDSYVAGVATDGQGNAYVAGRLDTTASLLAKYDGSGSLLWTSPGTGAAGGVAGGVVTDAQGDVYLTGSFRNTLQLGPTGQVISQGQYDGFLAKFSGQGSGLWVRQIGGSGDDAGSSVAVSPAGLIGLTGYFQGPATVGGATLAGSSSCGCAEAFVAVYDAQGGSQWARSAATAHLSSGTGLVFTPAEELAVCGSYEGQLTFGNQPALANQFPAGFVAQLTTTFPDLVVSDARTVQGSYHNVTITGTGSATLSGALQATGSTMVEAGGQLLTNGHPLTGPGSFALAAGAELRVAHAEGIAASGGSGAIQVSGSRLFSPEAAYTYAGLVPQQTGTGLPAQVRTLTVLNQAGLRLTQALRIGQGLHLASGDLQVAGQALTLLSSAAGTAQVDNAGGIVQGLVTVQRYLDPGLNAGPGYRHLSSPVRGSSVADLATASFTPVTNPAYNTSPTPRTVQPFPTVQGYDERRLATTNSNLPEFDKGFFSPASTAAPLETLRGYAVQLAANQTVDFVGELHNGSYTAMLTRGAQAGAGWNLVGNPYPSTLDWRRVAVPAGLDNAVYVFQSSGPYTGSYRSYVNGVGNPLIALGQAFMVRLNAGTSAVDFTLTNAARAARFDGAPTLNRSSVVRPLVELVLRYPATGRSDATTVYFEAGATTEADAGFDAFKLKPEAAEFAELSSVTPAGTDLAINGLPLPSAAFSVPLRLRVSQPGGYVLQTSQFVPVPGMSCRLYDALAKQSVKLQAPRSYSFSVDQSGLSTDRFSLLFTPN
jgi:hypothetical protein